eukprot:6742836-Pyramimonas_sp.AAC.1
MFPQTNMTIIHTLPNRLFHRRVSGSPAGNDDSSDRIGGERGQDTMVKWETEKVKQMNALQERYHSAREARFLPLDDSDDDSSDCYSSDTGSVGDLEDSWTDEQ